MPFFRSKTAFYRLKYTQLRAETHEFMLAELAHFTRGPLTDLTAIDNRALDAWRGQWVPSVPKGEEWSDWDWADEAKGWRRYPARFEVAVWSGDHLCGLAIGKPSRRRENLSIYVMQGSPVAGHPLRGQIIPIVLDVAGAYGTALGCKELRLVNPLRGIVGRYEREGFTLEKPQGAAPYCVCSL